MDSFPWAIEISIAEEFDDTLVSRGRSPIIVDGKSPHWDGREGFVEGKDKEVAFVTNTQEAVLFIPGERGGAVRVGDGFFKGCSVLTKECEFHAGKGLSAFTGISIKKSAVIA
jgi:hypothetical protein